MVRCVSWELSSWRCGVGLRGSGFLPVRRGRFPCVSLGLSIRHCVMGLGDLDSFSVSCCWWGCCMVGWTPSLKSLGFGF